MCSVASDPTRDLAELMSYIPIILHAKVAAKCAAYRIARIRVISPQIVRLRKRCGNKIYLETKSTTGPDRYRRNFKAATSQLLIMSKVVKAATI